ncbi:MAG: class I SAM-dependent methyltransferase, partial [Myxococcota bacterium]
MSAPRPPDYAGAVLPALDAALDRRAALFQRAAAASTDAYRVLHGAVEGVPGVAIDRYGPILLIQTWREPLEDGILDPIRDRVSAAVGAPLVPVWNHRARGTAPGRAGFDAHHPVQLPHDPVCTELGVRYDANPRHRGQDPLLFLDLRAVRRRVLAEARGRSVLNLFAYTCGVGVCAAIGGATEVVNVDFADSALAVGRRNAALNGLDGEVFRTLKVDALGAIRRFAGLSPGRAPLPIPLEPRSFDLVVLDPPAWSTGRYGAVDVIGDYPSLFKPAVLATRPGGVVVATNHVPSVSRAEWVDQLDRCARKAGRPLAALTVIAPEEDFPTFDGEPPLKVAWCTVGRHHTAGSPDGA